MGAVGGDSGMDIKVRDMREDDIEEVYSMNKGLQEFQGFLHPLTISLEEFRKDGFGNHPLYRAIVAEANPGTEGGKVVGFALYNPSYNIRGKSLVLEHLFVHEDFRSMKVGEQLVKAVSKKAIENGFVKIKLKVGNCNQRTTEFYKRLGATFYTDPETFIFSEQAVQRLSLS